MTEKKSFNYTRDLVGSVTRPLKELKGFKKILKKGEKRQ
jgi:hypothetical protein